VGRGGKGEVTRTDLLPIIYPDLHISFFIELHNVALYKYKIVIDTEKPNQYKKLILIIVLNKKKYTYAFRRFY
jgi:hypothetical protein